MKENSKHKKDTAKESARIQAARNTMVSGTMDRSLDPANIHGQVEPPMRGTSWTVLAMARAFTATPMEQCTRALGRTTDEMAKEATPGQMATSTSASTLRANKKAKGS